MSATTNTLLPMEVKVRTLDLLARTLDLTNALVHATSTSNPFIKGAWEIGQWLGREKLNQYELEDCMRKAKGLVTPNRNGQALFDSIIRGGDGKPVKPLFLQQSGSLGRLMAGDPQLCWLISTVACLFQFHSSSGFISATIIAFIMQARPPHDISVKHADLFIYHPSQVQLQSVVDKIVSSVWYNVINAGCDTIPLPEELLSVCSTGHYLDAADFGIVAHALQARRSSKVIFRSDHLLRNITLWLLLHYDGLFVVNLSGRIIYERKLGTSSGELEIHVKLICPTTQKCNETLVESYHILEDVAGKFEDFLSGYSSRNSELPPQPGIRQAIYEVPRQYPVESVMWNHGIQTFIKCTAQYTMRWLLNIRVTPQKDFADLGFSVILDPGQETMPHKVSTILARVPAMMNMNWGSSPPPQLVFSHKVIPPSRTPNDTTDNDSEKRKRRFEEVIPYFPILQDLLRKVRPDCHCNACRSRDQNISYPLQRGCLRRIAFEETMLLLAHGIADGFNVQSVSAITNIDPIVEGMTQILYELGQEKKILWDTWFGLAASVYLGCPFKRPPQPNEEGFGGTTYAAVQYGNLAAVAPWLDLSKELTVLGCFELIEARGRLGVITHSRDDERIQFRSVEENFAIIETENTEDTTAYNSRFRKESLLPGSSVTLSHDDTAVNSDLILVSTGDNLYRLLMRVKSSGHWRIIDPSDAMSGVIRNLSVQACQHKPTPLTSTIGQTGKTYTFDEVLGRWPDTVQPMQTSSGSDKLSDDQRGIIHFTHVLDTYLKQNVALALSVSTTAVQNQPLDSCLSCATEQVRTANRTPLREGEGGNKSDRYVINIRPSLSAGTSEYPIYQKEPRMGIQAPTECEEIDEEHPAAVSG